VVAAEQPGAAVARRLAVLGEPGVADVVGVLGGVAYKRNAMRHF
jgi:hypothetical protein